MAKKKKDPLFEPLGPVEEWEKGRKISKATMLKRKKNGVKGISVQIGSKAPNTNYRRYGRTIWIDEDLDLPNWLGWFIKTVKKLYFKLFGKKVLEIDESIEYYQAKINKLTQELAEAQKRLEETEAKSEERKQLLELAKKSIDELEYYKNTFQEFKNLIEESYNDNVGKEEEIKNKIKSNHWLLGLECHVEAKNKNIDIQTQIDLHIITRFGHHRIFEIKSPNIKPFLRKDNDKKRRLIISSELADGLSELIIYMRKTDVYSASKMEGTYGIQKASGVIIIGYKLEDAEKEMLTELNFHLRPHIQIVTFDELIENIKQELEVIGSIK